MITYVSDNSSWKPGVLRCAMVVVIVGLFGHMFAERVMGCCVTDVDMWVGKTALDAANKTSTYIRICKGETAYFYAECTVQEDTDCRKIKWTFDFDDSSSTTKYTWDYSGPCPEAGDTFDMAVSHSYGSENLFLPCVEAERVGVENCEYKSDCCTVNTDTKMKLEKVGDTQINSSNNYSEDTTIRITAVSSKREDENCAK